MNRIATAPNRQAPKCRVPGTPLTSFPVELLDLILGLVVKSLLQSVTKERVGCVLQQYRALVFTCRLFKLVLDNASTRILVQNPYHHSLSGLQILVLDPNTPFTYEHPGPRPEILTNWASVFKAIQKICVFHIKIYKVENYANEVGKFWMNPTVTPGDIRLCGWGPCDVSLILCLGPLFQRNKRRPIEDERKRVPHLPSPYCVGEIAHVITTSNTQEPFCSVRTWGAKHFDHRRPNWTNALSSSKVAKQVSEWWVWERLYLRDTYIIGYHKKNVWLVHPQSGEVYTNFPKRPGWRY
jgi:hypothetical protein